MKEKTMKDAVAILCAGGPAPGINTVISCSHQNIFTEWVHSTWNKWWL